MRRLSRAEAKQLSADRSEAGRARSGVTAVPTGIMQVNTPAMHIRRHNLPRFEARKAGDCVGEPTQ